MKIDHSKIWEEIGDAFETPYEERTDWQKRITNYGLCYAFNEVVGRRRLNILSSGIGVLGRSMRRRLWWWRRYRIRSGRAIFRVDLERATFAYFMAAMGNREYKKLIKAVKGE